MTKTSTKLAIITPSYGPDAELCRDLNQSVLAFTADDVVHHIVVPPRDRARFADLNGDRTMVHDAREFLPRGILKLPAVNAWVNATRPWPPIRGWILQQIVKLSATAAMDCDAVLLMDSDMVLIRETALATFCEDGPIPFFRMPEGIDNTLPRHRRWHEVARGLLGLSAPAAGKLPDYVCWPCLWEPRNVSAMLQRIEETMDLPWATAIGRQLHFSEMILYGVYMDEFADGATPSVSNMKCVNYWDERPLNESELAVLLDGASPDDVAAMISAKSGTPLSVRRSALEAYSRRAAESTPGGTQ